MPFHFPSRFTTLVVGSIGFSFGDHVGQKNAPVYNKDRVSHQDFEIPASHTLALSQSCPCFFNPGSV